MRFNPINNWQLKLLALVSSLLLWLFVVGVENYVVEVPFSYTPKVEGLQANWQVLNDLEKVHLKVKSNNLADLKTENWQITVDASQAKLGENTLPIQVKESVGAAKVVSVEPKEIKVMIDQIEEKSIPIKLQVKGQPAEGFQLYKTTISPSTVAVKGFSAELSNLNELNLVYNLTGTEQNNLSEFIKIRNSLNGKKEILEKVSLAQEEIAINLNFKKLEPERPLNTGNTTNSEAETSNTPTG